MAITEVTMYRVVCDYAGCGVSPADDEYYAWTDADSAELMASENDSWLVLDGHRHYCPTHVVYDDDEDEYVPAVPELGRA